MWPYVMNYPPKITGFSDGMFDFHREIIPWLNDECTRHIKLACRQNDILSLSIYIMDAFHFSPPKVWHCMKISNSIYQRSIGRFWLNIFLGMIKCIICWSRVVSGWMINQKIRKCQNDIRTLQAVKMTTNDNNMPKWDKLILLKLI